MSNEIIVQVDGAELLRKFADELRTGKLSPELVRVLADYGVAPEVARAQFSNLERGVALGNSLTVADIAKAQARIGNHTAAADRLYEAARRQLQIKAGSPYEIEVDDFDPRLQLVENKPGELTLCGACRRPPAPAGAPRNQLDPSIGIIVQAIDDVVICDLCEVDLLDYLRSYGASVHWFSPDRLALTRRWLRMVRGER